MTDQTDLSGNLSSSSSSSSLHSSSSPSLVSDVLIVGTGLTACMCAASLARHGAQVIQIDEGDNYGSSYQSLKFHELLHLFSFDEDKEEEEEDEDENSLKQSSAISWRSSPRSSSASSSASADGDLLPVLSSSVTRQGGSSILHSSSSLPSSSACSTVASLSPRKESLPRVGASSLEQERKANEDEEEKSFPESDLCCEERSSSTTGERRCYLTWREDACEIEQGKSSSFSLSVRPCRRKSKEKDEEQEEEACSLAMCMTDRDWRRRRRRRRMTTGSSPRSYLFRSFTSRSCCFFPFMKKKTKRDAGRDGEGEKHEGKRRREGEEDDEEGEENSKKKKKKETNGSCEAANETSVPLSPPGKVYVHPDRSLSVGCETASKKNEGSANLSSPDHTSDRREEDDDHRDSSSLSTREEEKEEALSWMKREKDSLFQRRISSGFSIDLLPRFLYSSSDVVNILVRCGGSRYLEFRPIATPVFVGEIDGGEEEEESENGDTEKEEEEDSLHAREGKELSTSWMRGENKKEKEMKGRGGEEEEGARCLDGEMKMKKSRGSLFPERMDFSLARPGQGDRESKRSSRQDQGNVKENRRIDLEQIPLSRSSIFSSGVLTLREKRLLMKFISGVASQHLSPLFLSAARSWRREDSRGKTEKKSQPSIEEGEAKKSIQVENEKKGDVFSSSVVSSTSAVIASSQEKKLAVDDQKEEKDSRCLSASYTNNEEEKRERENEEEEEEEEKRRCSELSWKAYLDQQNLTERLQRYLTFGLCLCESPLSLGGTCSSLDFKKEKESAARENKKKLMWAVEEKKEENEARDSLKNRRDDGIVGQGFRDANEGQKRLELFIRSLGVYGQQQTATGGGREEEGGGGVYLYPLFGASDFSQAFSRVASLSEAIYMLRAGITSIQISSSSSSSTSHVKGDQEEIERKEEKEKEEGDASCEGSSEDVVKVKRQEDQEKRENVVRKKEIPNLSDLCLHATNTSPSLLRVCLTNGECIETRLILFEADALPPLDTPVEISEKGEKDTGEQDEGKKTDEEEELERRKNEKRGRDEDVCVSIHSNDFKERRESIGTRPLGEILFGGVSCSLAEDDKEKKKKRRKMEAAEKTEKADLDSRLDEHTKGLSEGSDEKQAIHQREGCLEERRKTREEEEDEGSTCRRAKNDEEVSCVQRSLSTDEAKEQGEREEKKDYEEPEKEDDKRENFEDVRCSCHLIAICRQPILKGKGFRLCVCTVRKRVGDGDNKKKRSTSSRGILDLSFSPEREGDCEKVQWPVHILQTDVTCGTAPQGYTLLHLSHVCTPGVEGFGCTSTTSVDGCSSLELSPSICYKRSKEEKRGRRPCRMLWNVLKRLLFSSCKRRDEMKEKKGKEGGSQRQFSVERDCLFTCSYLFRPSCQTSYEREWMDKGVRVLARHEGVFRDIVLRNARQKKENELLCRRGHGREETTDTEKKDRNEENNEEICMDRSEIHERRNEKGEIDERCHPRKDSSDERERDSRLGGCMLLPPPPVVPLYTLLREPEDCLHVISTLLGQPELSIEDLIPPHIRQGLDDAEARRQFLTAPYEQLEKLVEEKEEEGR